MDREKGRGRRKKGWVQYLHKAKENPCMQLRKSVNVARGEKGKREGSDKRKKKKSLRKKNPMRKKKSI